LRVLGEDALAIVGMESAAPERRLRQPLDVEYPSSASICGLM
jgi:hypothetical protein